MVVRFGPFELRRETGELRKHGIRVRLQAKPGAILEALLEAPGEIVTREQLRRRLWSEDTFVDFENGLNTAMNRLRLTLGDAADQPRYIETLARNGYRFIAPVERVEAVVAAATVAAPQVEVAAPQVEMAREQRGRGRRWWIGVGLAAAFLTGFLYARLPRGPEPRVRQLTFGKGQIWSAHFRADGRGVVYTGQWGRQERQLYETEPGSPESRGLGFAGMTVAGISRQSELALLEFTGAMNIGGGTLYRAPLHGGARLKVDENIAGASWTPDGSGLAVIRAVAGANQIEYPAGKVLYRTTGWLAGLRFSPEGRELAFVDHPTRHEYNGAVKVVGVESGEVRTVAAGWSNVAGLAWHPVTGEVWFTAARSGGTRGLWAAGRNGQVRAVAPSLGILTLRDISGEGRLLVTRDERRLEMAGSLGGREEENLTWLDWSRVQEVSAGGELVLFDENGEGAGDQPVVYLYRVKERNAVRLAAGRAMGLTPDGKAALVLDARDAEQMRLYPVEGGAARAVAKTGLQYQWARYFRDGRLLALAAEAGKPLRLWVQEREGGKAVALSGPVMVRNAAIAPDGEQVAALTPERGLTIYRTRDGAARTVGGGEPLAPVRWLEDGGLLVQHLGAYMSLPAVVSRLDPETGKRTEYRRFAPAEAMGVTDVTGIAWSGDGGSYVYSYRRTLADLYLVEGW